MTRPSGAAQSGHTLLEMMVAVGISSIVITASSLLIVDSFKLQSRMLEAMNQEDMRSVIRQHLRCDISCNDIKSRLPTSFKNFQISYDCSSLTLGIMAKYTETPTAGLPASKEAKPVFDAGGYPCQGRTPANCVYACHWNGEIDSRGYLSPPLTGSGNNLFLSQGQNSGSGLNQLPSTAGCVANDFFNAKAKVVGIDFSTGRAVCADDKMFGPPGPLCKSVYSIAPGPLDVTLSGETPCTQYSQYQAENITLGDKLRVNFASGYTPSNSATYTIIVANNLSGRFTNAPGAISTTKGTFVVAYGPHTVTLQNFQPNPPSGLVH